MPIYPRGLAVEGERSHTCVLECSERGNLWSRYNSSLNVFMKSEKDLEESTNPLSFAANMLALHAAKDECDRARNAWEEHLRVHKCDEP